MLVSEAERLTAELRGLADRYGRDRSALLPILHEVQRRYRHIPAHAMQVIADLIGIHPVEVYGVVSFYGFLAERPTGHFVIRVCRSVACELTGRDRVARQLENDLGVGFGQTTPDGMFSLCWTNCMGMCDLGPALLVNDRVYTRVGPQAVAGILEECRREFRLRAGHLPEASACERRHAGRRQPDQRAQSPPATEVPTHHGPLTFARIEPTSGLRAALALPRAEVIARVSASGLRGCGGAGFPVGTKWKLAAAVDAPRKYLVCNADEGEPGTFKDRLILAEHAGLVFDGMTIAGYALGADIGLLYLRAEYALLRPHLEQLLARRREQGLLGADVLGSGFDFEIEIRMGAGAYICGEETALIESLEGHRGEPRDRPPFPVEVGFNGRPTVVNNVESLAWAAAILTRGPEWFRGCGTPDSPGLKLLSVSGDCAHPGVYEFPFGISIAGLLEAVGGEDAKAVQVGGAAGVCLPRSAFGRRICFEDVATGGAVTIFGPRRDMLAVAENFLEFFVEESCGQCTPCREGTPKLLEGVRLLRAGRCSTAYLRELLALAETMQLASKCGLGQSSPNAFVSIVRNFADEVLGRNGEAAASAAQTTEVGG